MAVDSLPVPPLRRGRTSVAVIGYAMLFAGLAVAGLTWAKWWPYSHKLAGMLGTHVYPGKSVLDAADAPGAAPSWHAGWDFAVTYGKSVWIALVAALVVAAGVEALIPRRALVRALRDHGGWRGPLVGGALSVPRMMCTCCTAPVTTSLRRSGVPTTSALAYWLGNPLLNPAVLAFVILVLPWQYMATRLAIGVVVVFGFTAVVGRLGGEHRDTPSSAAAALEATTESPAFELRSVPLRYLRALGRLAVVLVPEYFVVVLAVGAFRGWLLPLGDSAAGWGVGAVLLAAVAGTLMVIPTGGEIPIITGLLAVGFGVGVTGALLIALPALSLPSMVMVGRALTWRVTLAMAGAVTLAGLGGAALLSALGHA